MPFDMAPQETRTKFQDVADAIMRGCAMSGFAKVSMDAHGNTCAAGAAALGMGLNPRDNAAWGEWWRDVSSAYIKRYGACIVDDNDFGRFTREQIAARIAAL